MRKGNRYILLTEDHALTRSGLRQTIERTFPIYEILEAENGQQALAELEVHHQDIKVLMLDLRLPDANGLELLEKIHKSYPDLIVTVFSESERQTWVDLAFQYGAQGFIPKSSSEKELINALRRLLAGQNYEPSQLRSIQQLRPPISQRPRLTIRQLEVLQRLCKGCSNKEIARDLRLADNTVRVHVKAIFSVLKTDNRTKAANLARQYGLCEDNDHHLERQH